MVWEPKPAAIVIASLLPLTATVAAARLHIDTGYPFGDIATVTVTATAATTVKIRIPGWATKATVDGKPATNGTLVAIECAVGSTVVNVDLAPAVVVERGWGDTLKTPVAASVAVTRGPLVFALHPKEDKTVVRWYNTTPPTAGVHAPDYLISTKDVSALLTPFMTWPVHLIAFCAPSLPCASVVVC